MEALQAASRASMRNLLRAQAIRQRPNTQAIGLHTQPTFRTRPNASTQARYLHSQPKRPLSSRFTSRTTRSSRRWESSDAALDSKPDAQLSLTQRLKKLSREYGWAAFYIYFGLSALDFPFCFLAVKMVGTDIIGHWEHVVVGYVKGWLQWPISGTVQESIGEAVDKIDETIGTGTEDGKRLLDEDGQAYGVEDHGYKEAEEANSGNNASIWTQLALAYAIHKSFIFIRIPLTAAVTPKVVKTLRGWGWNIGRPTRKGMSKTKASGDVGVNTKGSKVKPGD